MIQRDKFEDSEVQVDLREMFDEDEDEERDGEVFEEPNPNVVPQCNRNPPTPVLLRRQSDIGKRYLVLGVAGSGKSTFSQHSAEQWGAGKLWDGFRVIYLIQCRKLNYNVKQGEKLSIVDLILNHGPPVKPANR